MEAEAKDVDRIANSVLWSQFLFSLGHSLTSGAFLYYFLGEFGFAVWLMGLVQVLPEISESAGLASRWIVPAIGNRKRTWLASLLLARLFALGIPVTAAFFHHGLRHPAWWFVLSMIGWYACQGIGYAAYVSWLSEAAPERRWGRVFSRRQIGKTIVLLAITPLVAILRRSWANTLPAEQQWITYAAIFGCGGAIVILSALPLLWLPDNEPVVERVRGNRGVSLIPRSLKLYLAHSWWLSIAQGFSQTALFDFQYRVLKIPLEWATTFTAVMQFVQLAAAYWTGGLSDRVGDLRPLIVSVLAVSLAMPVFLYVTPETWPAVGLAYVIWGLFGVVNVCTFNLMLRLAPRRENMTAVSLQQHVGGILGGVAGLAGSWLLGRWMANSLGELWPYRAMIALSWIGRLTSVAPLVLISRQFRNREKLALPVSQAADPSECR